jgi:hypothetical protein
MSFPQYRIPVQRLKEEWAFRLRMERLRSRRAPQSRSRLTDNSEPWILNPSSVTELLEIARRVNQTVAKWSPPQDNSSKPKLPSASLDEVKQLFERFLDWEVCQIALTHPKQEVRD